METRRIGCLRRCEHVFNLLLGCGLDRIRLNALRPMCSEGRSYVTKQRKWYALPFIAVGNISLRWMSARSRVLTSGHWQFWESEIYRILHGHSLLTDADGWLWIPRWPGIALSEYLAITNRSDAEKLAAVQGAAVSLQRLHALPVCWPDGITRPLSHGDATVRNVILRDDTIDATWIDFDMVHATNYSDTERHADDFWALIFSAARYFPSYACNDLARVTLAAYARPSIFPTLFEWANSAGSCPNSFQLAQCRLGYDQYHQLADALRDRLRTVTSTSALSQSIG